jgi:small-conductance mechanosensitive channel/CRP-like cAMP-binding protein
VRFGWSHALVVAPLALLGLLAMARLARLYPVLRPLVGPFAAATGAAVVVSILVAGTPFPPWAGLALLVPGLVVLVRATVVAFQWSFRRRQGSAPPALLDSVVAVALYGIGAAVIARRWFGLELTPFLATSAVVGAVVGLALQDTLGNLFAGIALHTESPFRVGDWVRVGDRDGQVEQVSWRATRMRTWDGDTLILPNNEVARHALLNYSLPRSPHSRVLVLSVGYETPPDEVLEVLREAVDQVEGLPVEPRPAVRIIAFHEYAIHYEIRYFFAGYADYRRLEGEIHRLVWYHLRRRGIEFPYPIRQVRVSRSERAGRPAEDPVERLTRILRTVDLFRSLSEDDLRTVAGRFRPLRYAEGEKVIEEGSPGDSFFIVDRGELVVLKHMGGAPREIVRLRKGQFFGEMALLTGERRTATVKAVSDVDLFTIDKAGLHHILTANPAVAVDIATLLSERREALTQAEGDITARFDDGGPPDQLQGRILDRIRSYFGI